MGDAVKNDGPSKIEIAKALKHIKSITTPNKFNAIHKMLGANHWEGLDRAVAGLGEEDEFLLMCVLMGTATHLAPLEQRPSIAGGKAAPDLLARFQPGYFQKSIPKSQHTGYKCLIEVKSTTQDEFSIGGRHLQELRAFADTFGLPLVFAVRFLRFDSAALWVLRVCKEITSAKLDFCRYMGYGR